MMSVLLIMASAAAGTSGAPPNATNSSTGVVTDAAALYRTLPLKQLRLITPNHYGVSGTDAVTLVFNRAVVALGSTFHGGDGSRVNGVVPMLWSCNSDDGHSAGESPSPRYAEYSTDMRLQSVLPSTLWRSNSRVRS
eukprot:COSAG01_NODE_4509_length_4967_cov_2.290058_3_plen_137_part_00